MDDICLRCAVTVRIYGKEKCFGPGIAELLERVEQERSLRKATDEERDSFEALATTTRP